MKKPALLRTLFLSGLLVAGMNFMSSCDSCSRPDGNSQGTEDGNQTNGDTRGTETSEDNEGSGATPATNDQSGNTDNSGASRSSTGSGTGSSGTTGKNTSAAEEQAVTDQIENSSTTPRDKNGRPINSGGTSGSGMGTGTGSTGNNSKVTRPEDQN